jgi:hypothetical protein
VNGEPFYQHRPASWWREEVKQWVPLANFINSPFRNRPSGYVWTRQQRWWEEWLKPYLPSSEQSLALHQGDPAAIPVLLRLLEDDEPLVRWAAMAGTRWLPRECHALIPVELLTPLFHDPDPNIRWDARVNLYWVEREPDEEPESTGDGFIPWNRPRWSDP